jgi:acyl-CoA hydrolase
VPFNAVSEPNETEKAIGGILAGQLIHDGATLQIGIGGIPNATLSALKNHKNLGIHSEMISDGVMALMQCGAVTNSLKSHIPHRTVTCFLVGSKELYDFVDDNNGIYMDTADKTNNPVIIARNHNVVAINSAIEVDITGQICADSLGLRMISGVGGQLDFERGAALSKGGVPIICLPSRTKSGASTIVPTLKEGAGVTTSRYHAHYIVTEHGAVNVFGKDLIERARLLISIAAPEHRNALAQKAYERFQVLIQ